MKVITGKKHGKFTVRRIKHKPYGYIMASYCGCADCGGPRISKETIRAKSKMDIRNSLLTVQFSETEGA